MWVALGVVVILVVAGGWYYFSKNKTVTNTNNSNQVIANQNTNTISNSNINVNGNINSINANTNTASTQTYTHPQAGYSLRFLSSWHRISEASGSIDTFAPVANPPANSCFLKISTNGLLGHDTTLQKGPDQKITIAGVAVTKHTWIGSDGSVAYYNFELQKSGKLIGFEGSISTNVNNCNAVLDDIVSSFVLS